MNDAFTFPPFNRSCNPLKLSEVSAHTDAINCITVSRYTSASVVTGGDDCRVNVWKIGQLHPTVSLKGHTTPVESATFDCHDELVAAGARGGSIKVWDVKQERLLRTLAGHRSAVTSLDFHPFGDFLVSGSTDTNVKMWNVERSKDSMQTYKGHEAAVTRVTFTPDGKWVVSGDVAGDVRVWDVTAGKLMYETRWQRREPVVSFHFHPSELLLAAAYTHNIAFHDLDNLRLLSTTPREASTIRYAMFDPDGTALISLQPDSARTWTNWDNPHCHDSCEGRWDGATDMGITATRELLVASKHKNVMRIELVDLPRLAPYKPRKDQENIPFGGSFGVKAAQARGGGGGKPSSGGAVDEWTKVKSGQHAAMPTHSSPAVTAASAAPVTSGVPLNDSHHSTSPKPAKSSILASPNAAFFRAHATSTPVAVSSQQQPQQPQQAVQPAVVSGWPSAAAGRSNAQVEQKAAMPTFEQQLMSPASVNSSASSADGSSRQFTTPQSAVSPSPAAPTSSNSTLIPSQPTHPLNLSFSSFLPPAPLSSPPLPLPPLPSLDSDVLRDRLLEQHDVTLRALHHRRQNLHTLATLWCTPPTHSASSSSASIRTLCATLVSLNDPLVAADFLQSTLPQFSHQPLLTLDCALLLLPLLRAMLTSKYERCVLVALRYCQLIVASFGQLVREARSAAGSGGVDVVGDERRVRCEAVWRELCGVASGLDGLKGSTDVVDMARHLKVQLQDVVEE